jgi:acyl-CoA thioester hydrolase
MAATARCTRTCNGGRDGTAWSTRFTRADNSGAGNAAIASRMRGNVACDNVPKRNFSAANACMISGSSNGVMSRGLFMAGNIRGAADDRNEKLITKRMTMNEQHLDAPVNGLCVSYCRVERDWLDYNEHMNVAFYLKAFDDASETLTLAIGMGAAHTRATNNSWVALESHLGFRQEAHLGDELRIESRVLDVDARKFHLAQEMYRDDTLLATHEQLGLHFNTASRSATPFAAEVYQRLCELRDVGKNLPRLNWMGRTIALNQAKPGG